MSTAAATTPTGTQTTTWTIDPAHTHAGFAVRHLMISTVRGRFTEVTGTVVSDDPTTGKGTVDISINVGSVDTREPQRDAHLRSADFFHADNHPTITFHSTRTEPGSDGTFRLIGDLTIRGTTHEVAFDVTPQGLVKDPWGGQRAGFSATAKIKRSDYGLTWNILLETGGVTVGDDVKIEIEAELVKQA
jgi:polyisoprenoid-binding protein YceI